MIRPTISVVIPTRNRPQKLADTVACLGRQALPWPYEIVVVDDGSQPPLNLPREVGGVACTLVRKEGVERSLARNAGAAAASGDLLVFVDDDLSMSTDFLAAHLGAAEKSPGALQVGAIRLPEEALQTPFGRFRQRLEDTGVPFGGVPSSANFCAAGNMAMPRQRFLDLKGFDPGLVSAEDQDLALRHKAGGGAVTFVPEAAVVHHDSALDIRGYCRRAEWGMRLLIPFCQRYPDMPENRRREQVNGPIRWRQESIMTSCRKMLKALLASTPVVAVLFSTAWLLERCGCGNRLLDRVYRLLLGTHLLRGYRKGLKQFGKTAAAWPAGSMSTQTVP